MRVSSARVRNTELWVPRHGLRGSRSHAFRTRVAPPRRPLPPAAPPRRVLLSARAAFWPHQMDKALNQIEYTLTDKDKWKDSSGVHDLMVAFKAVQSKLSEGDQHLRAGIVATEQSMVITRIKSL